MCLGIPGKIESIEGDGLMRVGRVTFGGTVKEAHLGYVPEAAVGDYVVVHAGFAISRVGTGTQHTWSTLALLWLLPWRTLARHARRRLLNRWANDLLRAITGTTVGEAFAFIQFPVHPLVKEPGDAGTRLLRLQPRVFHAADFDHSPYFDVIKAPYLLDKVPTGFGALPWKGNAGALAPEQRKRHLSVVDG